MVEEFSPFKGVPMDYFYLKEIIFWGDYCSGNNIEKILVISNDLQELKSYCETNGYKLKGEDWIKYIIGVRTECCQGLDLVKQDNPLRLQCKYCKRDWSLKP